MKWWVGKAAPAAARSVVCVLISVLWTGFGACGRQEERCPLGGFRTQVDYRHPEEFLDTGAQTDAGPSVLQAVSAVQHRMAAKSSPSQNLLPAVDSVIHELVTLRRTPGAVLTRTAEEVLADGWASGCHDYALVAAAILRRMGHPAVFVETVHDSYLAHESSHGHVFLEVGLPQDAGGYKWLLYDPTNSRIYEDWQPGRNDLPRGYHVYARYAEPWDAGLGSSEDLMACMDESARTKPWIAGDSRNLH